MPKRPFEPCIPSRGIRVPVGNNRIHEIKHDGCRVIVQREGKRVRPSTRKGHDWLRNRANSFVIDGEAVLLGGRRRLDFEAGSLMPRCSFTPSTL